MYSEHKQLFNPLRNFAAQRLGGKINHEGAETLRMQRKPTC